MAPSFAIARWAALTALALCAAWPAAARAQGDLDRAYRTIAGKKFVDLTHSFGPETPVWSGFGQARMYSRRRSENERALHHRKDGFRTTFYEMVGQYGTHVDPPAHFAEKRHHHGRDPAQADDPAADRARRHAVSGERSQSRLLGRRHQGVGEEARPRAAAAHSPRCAPTCPRTGTAIPSGSNAARSRRGRSRRSSSSTSSAASPPPATNSIDTDTTDKMESETYLLQKGHYQIEVMANLDKVAAEGRADRRDLAQGAQRLGISGAGICDPAVAGEGVGPAAGLRPTGRPSCRACGRWS